MKRTGGRIAVAAAAMIALGAGWSATSTATPTPSPGSPALRWSAPIPLGPHGRGAKLLAGYRYYDYTTKLSAPAVGVACPTASQCTMASDRAVTFDPLSGKILRGFAKLDGDGTFSSIACPTASQCTIVDTQGNDLTYNPLSGRVDRLGVHQIDGGDNAIKAISCPTADQCTEVNNTGEETTFDPQTGRQWHPGYNNVSDQLAPGQWRLSENPLMSVACPSVTQCTTVGMGGNGGVLIETTFDPRTGQIDPPGVVHIPDQPDELQTQTFISVACPSTRRCVAATVDGRVVTFDPAVGPPAAGLRALTAAKLFALSCSTQTACTAVDTAGSAFRFDARNPAGAHRVTAARRGGLYAVTCRSASECVAVTGAGDAVVGRALSAARRRH